MGHISFILVLETFFHQCNSDIALHHFKDINVFTNIPKLWHGYIRTFMYRYLEQISFHDTVYRDFPLQIIKHCQSFVIFSKRTVHEEKFEMICQKRSCVANNLSISTSPSGQLFPGYGSSIHSEYVYFFLVHPKFKLNFTFYEIYTSDKFERLNVYNSLNTLLIHMVPSFRFMYQGFYSTFCLYPKYNKVSTVFMRTNPGPASVNGSFTVMDANIIHNVPVQYNVNMTPNFIYHTENTSVLSYFLQVQKVHQVFILSLSLMTNKFKVYDGPGILSNTLMSRTLQKCSTFQCIIYILTYKRTFLKFYSKMQPLSKRLKIHQGKDFSISLPNKNCLRSACILLVNTEYGFQVNATLTKITSVGSYNPICTLSGVVGGEALKNDYRQTETVCENHDETKNPSRSFYSHNSSLILVLYWYKPYSVINVTVKISKTKCKPVRISVCQSFIYCWQNWKKKQKCQHYLKYVALYSQINISLNYIGERKISYTQLRETCIVFIIMTNVSRAQRRSRCSVSVIFQKNKINSIKGALYKDFFLSYFLLVGISPSICPLMKNFSINCHQDVPVIKSNKIQIGTNIWDNNRVFKTKIYQKPEYHILRLGVHFHPYCNCWIEIISINYPPNELVAVASKHILEQGKLSLFYK